MARGFFLSTAEVQQNAPQTMVPKCGACGLYKLCHSPKMEPVGRGKKRILIVGEAPGEEEDKVGKQFVGASGQKLHRVLHSLDVDLRDDCWTTNALICHPPNNKIQDKRAIEYCRPNLMKTIAHLDPVVIILLGLSAVKSLIGHLWKEDVGAMARWVGWRIPSMKPNAWICPTFHPAFLLRMQDEILDRLFHSHIKRALGCRVRPWGIPFDYRKLVSIEFDADAVPDKLRAFKGPLAFDYETNMLKPDSPNGRIVSCAVSDGQTSLAYPWTGRAIRATRDLLRSGSPMIASNLKFEERWTRAKLGTRVKNWYWDTMLAAHTMDNRPTISSIKFQAFVTLGAGSWDDKIRPYLRSKHGSTENRIRDVPLKDLLMYNGLDSLLEHRVAMQQREEMGFES